MKQNGNIAGFTLVEVMISIIILLVGITGSLVAISTAMKRAAAAENKMESVHVAREYIERLRSDDIGFTSSALQEGYYPNSSLGFSYKVEDDPANSNIKIITVYAPWLDFVRGRTVTTEVATLFSRVRK